MKIQFRKFQGRRGCLVKGSRCLRFCSEALRAKRHVIHASVNGFVILNRSVLKVSFQPVCFGSLPFGQPPEILCPLHERTDKLRDQIFKTLYPRKQRLLWGIQNNAMFSVLVYVWKVLKTKMETLESVSESRV